MLLFKNLLFTFIVPGTVGVYLPWWIAGARAPRSGAWLAAAFVMLSVGAAVYGWCVWDFARFGRGTPAPIDAPKRLVVRGLYRFSRNPMYVGVLTVIIGWTILFGTAALTVYAAAVFGMFQTFILVYEEPHLAREFGDEHRAYCARVGRWLPRIGPREGTDPS